MQGGADLAGGLTGHQDVGVVLAREGFHAGGQVDRVADRGEFPPIGGADRANNGGSGIEADAQAQGHLSPGGAEGCEGKAHLLRAL